MATTVMLPLISFTFAIYLGTSNIFLDYSFFSYNMGVATLGTLFAFIFGAYVNSLMDIN